MKFLKNLFVIALLLVSAQITKAQSAAMKDPVSFKLKNGLTVVLAENTGTQKVYATLNSEATEISSAKAGAREVLNVMLNSTSGINGLRFDEKGIHLAANSTDFNKALTALSGKIQTPDLTQNGFEDALSTVNASLQKKDRYYAPNVTATALQALTLDDIKSFYSVAVHPAQAYLTIAGNINGEEMKTLVKKSLDNWHGVSASLTPSK
jgi:predicted Zn-dependent peptidase